MSKGRKQGPDSPAPVQLLLENGQRDRPIDGRAIRALVETLLAEQNQTGQLAIHWVTAARSAKLNLQFLGHEGPTDVITFDQGSTPDRLRGELFICVAEAVRQAREFGTTWQAELARYVIHGVLHLRGLDDRTPALRRVMKREEERCVRTLVKRHRHV